LNPGEDIELMVKTVSAHPSFKQFEQNGDSIGVWGFLDCGECGKTGTRAEFNADDMVAKAVTEYHVKCPYCGMVSEESDFPDSRIWDVYDYITK